MAEKSSTATCLVVPTRVPALRQPPSRWYRWAALGLVGWMAACGGDSDSSPPSRPPPLGESPVSCPGADFTGTTSFVYVRSDGADTDGCGASTTAACATVEKGLANCAAIGCAVLVHHGVYRPASTVLLRNGVGVYGSCLFDGEPARSLRSVIVGPVDQPAVRAVSITAATPFQGFVVRAGDASTPGGPSIAMTVAGSSGLGLKQLRLVAGQGAPGTTGADAGTAGVGGNGESSIFGNGGQACPGSYGGAAGHGGNGGLNNGSVDRSSCFVNCKCSDGFVSGTGGTASPAGSPPGGPGVNYGGQGCACDGRRSDTPGNGDGGGPGAAGACSQQQGQPSNVLAGTVTATSGQWQGVASNAGTAGDIGAGGGGGQAGGIAVEFVFGSPAGTFYNGAKGSGGGGGGCGGLPGAGGGQGGGSIALLTDTSATLDASNVLIAGPAGSGGNGGKGGAGGAGGTGGPASGGAVANICLNQSPAPGSGGAGGDGGAGGAGSGGAGGNGGPSIGLALSSAGAMPPFAAAYPGVAGGGGGGGSGGVGGYNNCSAIAGLAGLGGMAPATYGYGNTGVLASNQFLLNGQILQGPASQLEMQSDGNLCLYSMPGHHYQWCNFAQSAGAGSVLIMQGDGNLCVTQGLGGTPVWCSATYGHPGAYLMLLPNGRAAVTDGTTVLWSAP